MTVLLSKEKPFVVGIKEFVEMLFELLTLIPLGADVGVGVGVIVGTGVGNITGDGKACLEPMTDQSEALVTLSEDQVTP